MSKLISSLLLKELSRTKGNIDRAACAKVGASEFHLIYLSYHISQLVPKLVHHLSWSGLVVTLWLELVSRSVEELNQRKEGDSGKKVGGAGIQTSQSRALLLLPDFLPSYKYQLNKVRSQ